MIITGCSGLRLYARRWRARLEGLFEAGELGTELLGDALGTLPGFRRLGAGGFCFLDAPLHRSAGGVPGPVKVGLLHTEEPSRFDGHESELDFSAATTNDTSRGLRRCHSQVGFDRCH